MYIVEIAFQWTFSFVDQLNNDILENWSSANIEKTTVRYLNSWRLCQNNHHIRRIVIILTFFVVVYFFFQLKIQTVEMFVSSSIKVLLNPCCITVLYIPCWIKVLYIPCCIIYSRFWPSSCSSAPSSLCCTTSGSCSSWSVTSHGSWPPWWERHQRSHWTPPEISSLVRYDVMLLWWWNCNMVYVDITFYTNSENFYRSSKFFYLMPLEILVLVLK